MAAVPTVKIGSLEAARIVTGLWQVSGGHGAVDAGDAVRHMAALHRAGFTSFDMADHYGPAEELTGALIKQMGDENLVQASTKWCPEPGEVSAQRVRAAVKRSLERLESTSIDLLQFHWWDYLDARYIDTMIELEKLRKEGLIANLGLTNFDSAHLRILLSLGIPVVSNQVHYSLLDTRAAGEMTELCREYGVKLLCYGTLAGGFFSERWLDRPEPADAELAGNWSLMKYMRFIRSAGGWGCFQNLLAAVNAAAQKHGVSIANIAVRWVLDQPMAAAALVGARLGLSDHTDDNARVFSFELDSEDRAMIAEARDGLQPIPGDCGDEYRRPPYLTAAGDLSDHKTQAWRPALVERRPEKPAKPEKSAKPVERVSFKSGTPWESAASYSRAVRRGSNICVSGTTATHGDMLIGGDNPAAQTDFCLDKIQAAIEALGGRLEDVVRTRIFVPNIEDDWEAVSRVHGRRFAGIDPANTLVGAPLVGDGYRVEIEADALIL